ncbi:MAG: hypothetical protein COC00_002800 [Rhizobiales bacterium]|nr:hypothetical protein [Hyphomicrobiales bacterium]
MDPQSLKKINDALKNEQSVILLTEISENSGGRDRVIYQGDKLAGEMGEAIDAVFTSGNSSITRLNESEFFLNLYLP